MEQIEKDTASIKLWKLMKAPKSHWSKIAQYDRTATGLAPFLDRKTGRPKTGLSKETARNLEKELGLEENELSPRSKFWIDFQIKVSAEIQRLDLDEPEDVLAFHFLKSHKLVAFGHAELRKKPHAVYVLYNDVDEARATVKVGNVKKEAYKHFIAMDNQEMIDVLMVLGKQLVSTEPSIVEAMMGRVVEKEARAFLDIVGDDGFKMKLFILKCVHYDILSRSRGKDLDTALFHFGDDFLGEGVEKVSRILESKANQRLFLALEKRLEMAHAAGTLAGVPVLTGYQIENKIEGSVPSGPKTTKNKKKITSNAGSGKRDNMSIADNSVVQSVSGDGTDSGDFDGDAPEIL